MRGCARILLALALALGFVGTPLSDALAKKSRSTPTVAAAIVVDMNSGAVLHNQSADVPRHPASLTKMMTLYVLFGYMRAGKVTPTTDLVVTPHAASQAPTKLGLKPGAKIKVEDAIKALVTQSANDAAATIAENLAGTEANFARLMTDTARRIGMMNTTFRNASGLPNDEQITTARDMAILSTRLIQDYPEYYAVFGTRYFAYNGRKYRNHNKLLFGYEGTDGIKTGYTRASGFNLAASCKRGDKHLVAVVMGGRTGASRDAVMRNLLDKQFPQAATNKTAKGLIASLLSSASGPPPVPPAPKKPAVLTAATSAASAGSEGDIGEPGDSLQIRGKAKPNRFLGAYHVQVGAFMTQADAENRLGMVQQRAIDLLDGHLPFTASFMKDDQEWYRARFAGFSKEDAQAACAALKKRSLECVVMRAE
jgi:D-alanyl-D-alanine carboxypeptidase